MSHITYITIQQYCPDGVKQIVGRGCWCFIGMIDEETVLKYPKIPDESTASGLQVESLLLGMLGQHPRIIGFQGWSDPGLRLEYAVSGDLSAYLTANPATSLEQRLRWCIQAAEALVYVHSMQIIHCDISARNLLLDKDLDLKLSDFQGLHISSEGTTLLDGGSGECTKSWLPRSFGQQPNVKTDLFALGSAIYFIMTGHEVYPDLLSHKEDDAEEIERRFREEEFPVDEQPCEEITGKCWKQQYECAQEVLQDLMDLQHRHCSAISATL